MSFFDDLEAVEGPQFFIEAKDKDPRSEEKRQFAFLRDAKIICPGVHITPLLNDGKRSQWEQNKAKRLGLKAGEPDLELTWGGRGVAWIEFKNGTNMPSPPQVERLNQLVGMGHFAAVFRNEVAALRWLQETCGAPFIDQIAA